MFFQKCFIYTFQNYQKIFQRIFLHLFGRFITIDSFGSFKTFKTFNQSATTLYDKIKLAILDVHVYHFDMSFPAVIILDFNCSLNQQSVSCALQKMKVTSGQITSVYCNFKDYVHDMCGLYRFWSWLQRMMYFDAIPLVPVCVLLVISKDCVQHHVLKQ